MTLASEVAQAIEIPVAIAIADATLRAAVRKALAAVPVRVVGEISSSRSLAELVGEVQRVEAEVLLLGLAGLPCEYADAVREIRGVAGAPRIVAVYGSPDPQTILRVMRAGASEFIYPPFDAQFGESLARVWAESRREAPAPRPTGSVFGFVSAKGGCGATTVACHAAAYLRRKTGKPVLLADLDPCSGSAGMLMRTDPRYSILDALEHVDRMDMTLWKAVVVSGADGVDVLASPKEPASPIGDAEAFAKLVSFWRAQYDYTILDFGHGLTQEICASLDDLNNLVLISTDEMPALKLAKQNIETLSRMGVAPDRIKLVINRMPRRAVVQPPELEQIMAFPVYAVIPNHYQAVSEAYAEARLLEPESVVGLPIAELAAKLAGLPPETTKKRRFGLFG